VSTLDRRFYETFAYVIGGLVVFTIAMFILANHLAAKTQVEWDDQERASSGAVATRLAPVGQVAIAGETPPEPAAPAGQSGEPAAAAPEPAPASGATTAAAAGGEAPSGEKIYNETCFACHAAGVAGAPKFGSKEDWGPRIAQGVPTLVQHAVSGFQGQKGVMPPKGGRADYSDDQIAAAVQYMVDHAK
jgi:cytochrome c5